MKAFILIATLLASFVCTTPAQAHAFLDHAQPAVGSTIHEQPTEVQLWFTQQLEPAFSTVRVLDQHGKQVDKVDKQVDPHDPTLLKISLPPLASGKYRVVWRVLSVDTHVSKGDYSFTIAP
jgi:methionine-rich copper-binding protein CopC